VIVSSFEDLEQITAFVVLQRRDQEVVEHEDGVEVCDAVRAGGAGKGEPGSSESRRVTPAPTLDHPFIVLPGG